MQAWHQWYRITNADPGPGYVSQAPHVVCIPLAQVITGSKDMKKVIFISAMSLLAVVVFGGLGAAYILLSGQDRGTTADGRMAPPASVRNAAEAPKYDPSKRTAPATAEKPPEVQLPSEFKLPTELDIATPQIPEGVSAPADGKKS
jgi:hypothetical protein